MVPATSQKGDGNKTKHRIEELLDPSLDEQVDKISFAPSEDWVKFILVLLLAVGFLAISIGFAILYGMLVWQMRNDPVTLKSIGEILLDGFRDIATPFGPILGAVIGFYFGTRVTKR